MSIKVGRVLGLVEEHSTYPGRKHQARDYNGDLDFVSIIFSFYSSHL